MHNGIWPASDHVRQRFGSTLPSAYGLCHVLNILIWARCICCIDGSLYLLDIAIAWQTERSIQTLGGDKKPSPASTHPFGSMVTPNDAISAAIAATSSHEQDPSRKERPASAGSSPSHRRSISSSLSSAFAFSRTSQSPEHSSRIDSPSPIIEEPPSPRSGGAMATLMQQRRTRTRKGSLRKSALLGTSKLRMDGKDRRASSGLDEVQTIEKQRDDASGAESGGPATAPVSPSTAMDLPTPRPYPIPPPVPMVTHPVHGDPSKILEVTDAKEPFPDLKRHFTAKSSTASTTTDDDDSLNGPLHLVLGGLKKPPIPSDSYFPPQAPRLSRSAPTVPKSHSPLATLPPSSPASPPSEWDYSETRWWGWIILFVTWIVFVVGMGSCFGVWSWGMGCRRDTESAARARRRPDSAYRWVLSRTDGADVRHGMGVGHRGLGRHEVFQTCKHHWG